jgi:hypothetical protein
MGSVTPNKVYPGGNRVDRDAKLFGHEIISSDHSAPPPPVESALMKLAAWQRPGDECGAQETSTHCPDNVDRSWRRTDGYSAEDS